MQKRQIYGDSLKEQLLASARDRQYRFLMDDGRIRGVIICGTRMVNEMRANFELGILETLVLGHAYLGAGLMAAGLKGRERLQLAVDCNGPIKGFNVEANAYAEVRGHLKQVPIPIEAPLEDFNLAPFYGEGFMRVTRVLEDAKQPFTSQVKLKKGNLAQDLAHFHLVSEQIPTAFHLSVQFDSTGEVTGAGGYFLQAMPDAAEDVIVHLEQTLVHLPSLGTYLSSGDDPQSFIQNHLKRYRPHFLGSKRIEFLCHCNPDRLTNLLRMLPPHELKDMAENGPFPLHINCQNCNTSYRFDQPTVQALYAQRNALN